MSGVPILLNRFGCVTSLNETSRQGTCGLPSGRCEGDEGRDKEERNLNDLVEDTRFTGRAPAIISNTASGAYMGQQFIYLKAGVRGICLFDTPFPQVCSYFILESWAPLHAIWSNICHRLVARVLPVHLAILSYSFVLDMKPFQRLHIHWLRMWLTMFY